MGEHSRGLDGVREAVVHLEQRMDGRFEGVDRHFEAMDRRFEGLERRLDALDQKLDQRVITLKHNLIEAAGDETPDADAPATGTNGETHRTAPQLP